MIDNKRHVDYWWCKKYLCFPAVWLLNRPFHTGDLRPTFDIFPKSAKPLFPPKESKGSDGAKGSMFGREKLETQTWCILVILTRVQRHVFAIFSPLRKHTLTSGQQRRHEQPGSCTFILGTWLYCGCTVSFSMTTPEKSAFRTPLPPPYHPPPPPPSHAMLMT